MKKNVTHVRFVPTLYTFIRELTSKNSIYPSWIMVDKVYDDLFNIKNEFHFQLLFLYTFISRNKWKRLDDY